MTDSSVQKMVFTEGLLKKGLTPGLGQEMHKMNLQHLVILEYIHELTIR